MIGILAVLRMCPLYVAITPRVVGHSISRRGREFKDDIRLSDCHARFVNLLSRTKTSKNLTRIGLAGIGVFALVAAGAPAIAATNAPPLGTNDGNAPIDLSAPISDFSAIVDTSGSPVEVVSAEGASSADRSAVVVTEDDQTVLVKSLYGEGAASKERAHDAELTVREPGLDGWVEGETYFTDGQPQRATEELSFDQIEALDESSLDLLLSTATSSTSFSAAWLPEGSSSHEIYRDGQLITTTDDDSFTDTGLQPGTDYLYLTRATDGATAGTETTFQASTLPADATRVAESSPSAVQALAVPREASWFVYNTFITQAKVPWDIYKGIGGVCSGVPGDQYGGDNRYFRTPAVGQDPWANGTSRTGARVKIDFGPGAVIEQKNVGTTYLYNASGGVKETRTASTDGISFSERSVSANLYKVRIQTHVGNPFCQYGAIRANVYVNIWKSGTMQINGSRHPVPAHEAYGLFTNSTGWQYWSRMYEGAQGDFHCVSGTCPQQTIGRTHTPS